ncbi:thioredoxin domain-containing protein [Bauldia sp.]|uniref:thioredoxin domain-containing protein n=1 Tax=Bauldia sp. TaxID=2575872 RepID=UPI003BAA3B7D
MQHLAEKPAPAGTVTLGPALLDQASERLLGFVDRVHGGTRGAPKFPQASLLGFLWRAGDRTDNPAFREAMLTTLRNVAQGGIYDHLGGGFARYSVDDRWLVPHFEKMLYDNAQLITLMTQAFIATGDRLFSRRVAETIAWLDREMTAPSGAFAASIDADSEGVEGKFYVWQRDEVDVTLGDDSAFFCDVYDVQPGGNWEGVSILNRLNSMALRSAKDEDRLAMARKRLLARRGSRVRPATDDKILADWNGLTISALAFAAATFKRPEWLAMAKNAFQFVVGPMSQDGRLAHAWRDDKFVFPGLATDYANMIAAALALHDTTLDKSYVTDAERLTGLVRVHHWNASDPGYYLPADDAEALIVRPLSINDDATPAANSVMIENLVRLWHLTGKQEYRDDADAVLEASAPAIAANLFATTGTMSGLDFRLNAIDVVVIAKDAPAAEPIVDVVRRKWTPNIVLSVHQDTTTLPTNHPVSGKTAVDGIPTAYVCRGQTCSLPVTEVDALDALL